MKQKVGVKSKNPAAFEEWGEEVLAVGDQALPTQPHKAIKNPVAAVKGLPVKPQTKLMTS
jgi:hypothetical protein